jgi:hypothetical protein
VDIKDPLHLKLKGHTSHLDTYIAIFFLLEESLLVLFSFMLFAPKSIK